MTKIYRGLRTPEGDVRVTVETINESAAPLDPRTDLRNHSPTGFEWGYGGSGPAQLSLALLADALKGCPNSDDLAQEFYQRFKDKVISGMGNDRWVLSQATIHRTVAELRHQMEQVP